MTVRRLVGYVVVLGATQVHAGPIDPAKDPDSAIRKLAKICADGRSPECRTLAEYFLLESHMTSQPVILGVPTLKKICHAELERAADEWPIETLACRRVGEVYALGRECVSPNWPETIRLLQKASDAGDAVSSVRLGKVYEEQDHADLARDSYARSCKQPDFLNAERGMSEERLKTYRDFVAQGCARSTAEPQLPAPRSTACGAMPRRIGGRRMAYPYSSDPNLPKDAKKLSTHVVVELTVGVDGRASNVHVVEGDSPFMEPAVLAMETWQYEPARCDGVALPVTIHVATDFKVGKITKINATGF